MNFAGALAFALGGALAAAACPHAAAAQSWPANVNAGSANRADSTSTPYKPSDVRVVVSVKERQLWVIAGTDTVRQAPVSVASGRDFTYGGRTWRFATPRGTLRVQGKRTDPKWLPPHWHYAEVAQTHGLKLRPLPKGGARLRDGSRVLVRDSVAGLVRKGDTTFLPLPVDEHIVFDSTLFIPPIDSHNRHLVGELGKYALDLGNGYLLHGTPDQSTIGSDTTHGCIRLADDDLEWLYQYIPVGARVQVR